MNQIKGTIEYSLTLEENNVWKLRYNQTIENDIASIAITEHVLGILEERLRLDKKSAKGKEVGFFQQRIDKVIQAKFGLSLMFDYAIKLFDIYTKGMAAKADEAAKKAAQNTGFVGAYVEVADNPLTAPTEATKNFTDLSENKQ